MNEKKRKNERMNDEEYRLNKELIDELTQTPNVSKKNFLI